MKQPHPVNQITPVSKYLAIILFIILPFLGGYVGYRLALWGNIAHELPTKSQTVIQATLPLTGEQESVLASTSLKVDESDIRVSSSASFVQKYECTTEVNPYPHGCFSYNSNTSSKEINNLTEEAKAQGVISGRTALGELVYTTLDSSKMYFTAGVPDSDGCCSLISFDTKTLKFSKVDSYFGLNKSSFSKDKRYFTSIEDNVTLYVVDLETEKISYRQIVKVGSLVSTKCAFAGAAGYNVEWSELKQGFTYGLYADETEPNNQCKQVPINEGFIPVK